MFQNLRTPHDRDEEFKDMDLTSSKRGFHKSPGTTSSVVKGNERTRLVRCVNCGWICDKERDTRQPEDSWAFLGINQGSTLTAGTAISNATMANRTYDYAVKFDGKVTGQVCSASSAINIYDSNTTNSPFTFEAWVNPFSAGEGNLGAICYKDESANSTDPSNGYKFHVFASTGTAVKLGLNIRHGDGTDAQRLTRSAAAVCVINSWNHVAFTYNQNGDRLALIYVNGSVNTLGGSTQDPTGNLSDDSSISLPIGNRWKGDNTFKGMIKDVRIYHGAALTSTQILSNYNNSITPGYTAFWDYTEGNGIYAIDSVGGLVLTHKYIASSTSSTVVSAEWVNVTPSSQAPTSDNYYDRTVLGGCPACGSFLFDKKPIDAGQVQ